MIGNREKIQRLFHLHFESTDMFYSGTFRELIGLIWRTAGAKHIGIERKNRMNVGIAEIGATQRIRDDRRLCGCFRDRRRCRRTLSLLTDWLPSGCQNNA